MKKFDDFINEKLVTENEPNAPIKIGTRYRLEKGDVFMEFYVMSYDEEKDEVYMKVVKPGVAHQGVTLSSLIKAGPVEIEEETDEEKNESEENED